jgi:hypothetical protein
MGSITRGLSNNITTGGVILPAGITNASVSAVTSFANASGGTLTLISTQTASNSANISFTTGLNSTYDAYEFHFIDTHPRTASQTFLFNLSTDSGSNYNVTKTTTSVQAFNDEGTGTSTLLAYDGNRDLAQSTSYQLLSSEIGNGADDCLVGTLQLFNPSSTTYVKHFIANISESYFVSGVGAYAINRLIAGYGNTTSAINAVDFKFSSGNFDGVIKLYGVKKS